MELPRQVEPGWGSASKQTPSQSTAAPKSDAQLMLENILQGTTQSMEQPAAESANKPQDAKPRLMLMGLRR